MQNTIDSILQRLSVVEERLGIDAAATSISATAGPVPPAVAAYEAYLQEYLTPFLEICKELGDGAVQIGEVVRAGWAAQGRVLRLAAACARPAQQAGLLGALAPLRAATAEADAGARAAQRTAWEAHARAAKEAVDGLQWVCVEPCPGDYVEGHVGAADFWANKIRVAHKGGAAAQHAWCDALKALLQALLRYVKAHHTTGLAWNPQGGDVDSYDPSQPVAASAAAAPAAAAPAAAAGAPTGGTGAGAGAAVPPRLAAWEAHVAGKLGPFLEACDAFGPDLEAVAAAVAAAWRAQGGVVATAAACRRPAGGPPSLMPVLQAAGCQEAVAAADRAVARGEFENHAKAAKEVVAAVSWLMVEPAPADFVKEHIGGSDFWSNKVRVAHKGHSGHTGFCDALKALVTDLAAYVRAHHTTGLAWNPQGVDVSEYTPGAPAAAAAAPPKAPPAAAPAGGGGDAKAGLFSALNKGGGVTSGLKKVTRDMQTWRKEYKGPDAAAAPAPGRAAPGGGGAPAATARAAPVARPPNVEYQAAAHKWLVENQTREQGVVEVVVEDKNQSVYIYNCNDATINITGKCKGVCVDGCKKARVLLDTTVSSLEFVNCQRVQAQVRGTVPSVAIDKTDGLLLYLSAESLGATLTTSKSSEMNLSVPGPGGADDQVEIPIPEQFVHRIVPGPNPSVTSEVSDLYSG